jgi:hypothetical protein
MTRSSDSYLASDLVTEIASSRNKLVLIQEEVAKDAKAGVRLDWSQLTRLVECQENVKIHAYAERVFKKLLADAGIIVVDDESAATIARAAITTTMEYCLERMLLGASRSTNAASTMINEAEVEACAKFYRTFKSFV